MSNQKVALFDAFIHALNENAVPYCLLGGYEDYPTSILTDIDFMVLPEHFQKLPEFFQTFAATTSVQLVQALRHETTACYYVLAKLDGINLTFLHPDACSDYRRNGRIWLRAGEIVGRRRMHAQGFYVPAPADTFAYYLIKKIEKGEITDAQGGRLAGFYRESPAACWMELAKRFPQSSCQLIKVAAEQDDWRGVRENMRNLSAHLCESQDRETLPGKVKQVGGELVRKVGRFVSPSGMFVVFLGPDGSGKSSVISQVTLALAPAFRKHAIRHLRPGIGKARNGAKVAVTDPHGLPNRNLLASSLKLFFFLADYVLGYALVTRMLLVRSTLVIYDRYFHDLLVDPKRYRYGGAMWLARMVGKVVPQPDLWILLDAPPEVLQARKQEVAFSETVRQREAYLALARGMKNTVIVDASRPLVEVVAEVNSSILDFMELRTRKRLAS